MTIFSVSAQRVADRGYARQPSFLDRLLGGVIFERHDAWALRPVADTSAAPAPSTKVFVEDEQDSPTTISGLVGAIWRVRDGLSFDAGLRLARAGGVNTTEIRAGLTWAFSVEFPK